MAQPGHSRTGTKKQALRPNITETPRHTRESRRWDLGRMCRRYSLRPWSFTSFYPELGVSTSAYHIRIWEKSQEEERFKTQKTNFSETKEPGSFLQTNPVLALSIFTCSHPHTIVDELELNFCVRDGNRWTLKPINTNFFQSLYPEN